MRRARPSSRSARSRRSSPSSSGEFDEQVRAVYISGGNEAIGALLGSQSFSDFADRLRFAQNIVQGDEDLATSVAVQSERLAGSACG